jgi:hypothetical protein
LAAEADRGRRARLRLRTLVRGWPWYYETTAVFRNESLFRSIPNTPDYFKNDMGAWAVAPFAFKPHAERDRDGMSFFREDFVKSQAVADASRHPQKARVARITVVQLSELELDVKADPDASELPGHTIVPDMQYRKNQLDEERQRTKDRSQKLAQFATKNGVYSPPGLPDPVRTTV